MQKTKRSSGNSVFGYNPNHFEFQVHHNRAHQVSSSDRLPGQFDDFPASMKFVIRLSVGLFRLFEYSLKLAWNGLALFTLGVIIATIVGILMA